MDLGDGGPESSTTDPEQAVDFVERTGVDALAISFGNAHGLYRGEPNLDLDRVRAIHAMVDVPLVMHGASGVYHHLISRSIDFFYAYTQWLLDLLGCSGAAK